MKTFIIKNRIYITCYFIFLILTGIYLLNYTSEQFSLYINSVHTPFFDVFFKYVTHFGEVWFAVPICLYLFYRNKQWGIIASVISISSIIVSQTNKQLIFENALRPSLLLKDYKLNFVEGVEMAHYFSFPSGHTTYAFAIFTCLAIIFNKPMLQVLFLISALLVGFSRIYLLQHFLRYVFVGSMFCFTLSFTLYWIVIESKIKNKI